MELTLTTYLGLAAAGFCGGLVDSIAGGGGLITVPALLMAGLPPSLALGTNKLQSCSGALTASHNYLRRGAAQWRELKWPFLWSLGGSVAGAATVQRVESSFLVGVIPWLLILVGTYFLLMPRLGRLGASSQDQPPRLPLAWCGPLLALPVGFYDGFFGPGTGSFFALGLVLIWGKSLLGGSGAARVLNLASNLGALVTFLVGGSVVWSVGAAMIVGQVAGARLGSGMALKHGAAIIRPLVVVVSVILALKLWWS